MTIGVLALQGAFAEHGRALARLGVASREVRLPADLDGVAGLIIPGGESTTIGKLLVRTGLDKEIADRVAAASEGLGTAMVSLETRKLEEQQLLANRGW